MITSHIQNKTTNWKLARKGFSLVEVLIVIAIIAVLAAIAIPVAGTVAKNGKLKKNKEIVTGLKLAIDRFHDEYGHLPANGHPAPGDDETLNNVDLIEILRELEGKDDSLVYNTKGTNFLKAIPEAKSGNAGIIRSNGNISDITNAMGQPIFITLDYSSDEEIEVSTEFGSRTVNAVRALVWTFGNLENDATPEEILEDSSASWR